MFDTKHYHKNCVKIYTQRMEEIESFDEERDEKYQPKIVNKEAEQINVFAFQTRRD
jgi:hypothetical protein